MTLVEFADSKHGKLTFQEIFNRLEQVDNLKCCGNCKLFYTDCPNLGQGINNKYCLSWDPDGYKREEREIKIIKEK